MLSFNDLALYFVLILLVAKTLDSIHNEVLFCLYKKEKAKRGEQ